MRSVTQTRSAFTGLSVACAMALTFPQFAEAEGYKQIGYGRLVTNDLIGDGFDRWQTGGYASSRVFGRQSWNETLPETPGEILEFRLDALISAPDDLRDPDPGERPLTGFLRLGAATQFARAGWETELGASVTIIGPENGLVDLQTGLHDALPAAPSPSKKVRDDQLDLDPQLGASFEIGRPIELGGQTSLRPFVSGEIGLETYARAGLDLNIGSFGLGGLQARDRVTGQRYRVIDGSGDGLTFVLGGDIAYFDDTMLLREEDGVVAEEQITRLRAGVHWQSEGRHLFYGATWLSPETEAQDTGQTVGSIRIDWRF